MSTPYRGRLAPSPTGLLHVGHARTFWTAQQRARSQAGPLVLRNEDLDQARCKAEFVSAMLEDLHWFGFEWQEGPDCGGACGPYSQSERRGFYVATMDRLRQAGFVYPCVCSRQDVLRALQAPHAGDDEPIYPGTCRPQGAVERRGTGTHPPRLDRGEGQGGVLDSSISPVFQKGTPHPSPLPVAEREEGSEASNAPLLPAATQAAPPLSPKINWRFRVPDGEVISFVDGHYGRQQFVAGKHFGDFVVWRHDDVPSYQLAVVVDDAAMKITEVVRGQDLLISTARQLLLYRALDLAPPEFYHCPLVTDQSGSRLAKRHDSLSLRSLRDKAMDPATLRKTWGPQ